MCMLNTKIADDQLDVADDGTKHIEASSLGWAPGRWTNIIYQGEHTYRWVMSVVMNGQLWGWRYDKYADGAFVIPSETIVVVND